MTYEIDFLRVGEPGEDGKCSKSGDAIAIRWGNLNGPPSEQTVAIIDGGFTSSGEKIVRHVKEWYKTDVVDFVVSSHPHDDHISGLFPVLESLEVRTLLMHKPWEHARDIVDIASDGRLRYRGTATRAKESFECAWDLYRLAVSKGIRVVEPFQGVSSADGVMTIIGPSLELYVELLASDMAGAKAALPGLLGAAAVVRRGVTAMMRAIAETWDKEILVEPASDAVQPLNNTSTVIHFDFGDSKALLTADAGVLALERAADFADAFGIPLHECNRVQIPHHGSKRNVGPRILDRIVGPIKATDDDGPKTGMLSAAKDGEPKHPSARVTNAFRRRGAPACATQGSTKCFASKDAPDRGWQKAEKIPFRSTYDEEDS